MRKINKIIIHCSASEFGSALLIDTWHRQQGWPHIGYHYVIMNGKPSSKLDNYPLLDGGIEPGVPVAQAGIHVANHNADTIGICLIGQKIFTDKQLESTKLLVNDLLQQFSLSVQDVRGHYEMPDTAKTCPNIPMDFLRRFIESKIYLIELQKEIAKQNS